MGAGGGGGRGVGSDGSRGWRLDGSRGHMGVAGGLEGRGSCWVARGW